MSEPQPLTPVAPPVVTDPHVVALRENLQTSEIRAALGMVDVEMLLSLAAAKYLQSTSHSGSIPSPGELLLSNLTFTYQ